MAKRNFNVGAVSALAMIASLGVSQVAHASGGATVTSVSTGQPYIVPPNQKLVVDFDSPNKNGVTSNIAPSQIVSGTSTGNYAAPSDDSTFYAFVSPTTGSTTFNFGGAGIGSLSLLWGSVDAFNSISFSNGGVVTGSDVLTNPDGSQLPPGTKLVNISFSAPVTTATFSSSQNSFEFDNLAVSPAPEPATWGLMLGGVAFVGFTLRSLRRRNASVVAA